MILLDVCKQVHVVVTPLQVLELSDLNNGASERNHSLIAELSQTFKEEQGKFVEFISPDEGLHVL